MFTPWPRVYGIIFFRYICPIHVICICHRSGKWQFGSHGTGVAGGGEGGSRQVTYKLCRACVPPGCPPTTHRSCSRARAGLAPKYLSAPALVLACEASTKTTHLNTVLTQPLLIPSPGQHRTRYYNNKLILIIITERTGETRLPISKG